MVLDVDGDGKPLLIAIEKNVEMDRKFVNAIRSVYRLDNLKVWVQNQIDDNKKIVVYNEKEANSLLQTYGYSASVEDGIKPLEDTITQPPDTVNAKFQYKSDANYMDAAQQYLNTRSKDSLKAVQEFADTLVSLGYDGVIVEDFEYVTFNRNQMKLSDAITYDDNGKVIPLSERFDSSKKDIRYQPKKVDSDNDLKDNKNTNYGGAENGSQNTELLERSKISSVGNSRNRFWKQSENTARLSEILGVFEGASGNIKGIKAGVSGWLATYGTEQKSRGWRPDEGFLGRLSSLKLSKRDTAGRTIDNTTYSRFRNTVFKNEDGELLSLYHWTNAVFDVFARGQLGFHFGTLAAANNRSEGEKGFVKEVYLNINNPLVVDFDPMYWDVFSTAHLLEREGVITDSDLEYLEKLQGYHRSEVSDNATVEFKRILRERGYDGIIYSNWNEGDMSVLAFYPDQIYMVAENGIDISYDKLSNVDRQQIRRMNTPKFQHKYLESLSDTELMAKYLEENSEAVKTVLRKTAMVEMNPVNLTRVVKLVLRQYGISESGMSRVADIMPSIFEAAKHENVTGTDMVADLTDEITSV